MTTEFTDEQIEIMARVCESAVFIHRDNLSPGYVVGNAGSRRYSPDIITVEQADELLKVIDQRKLEKEKLDDLIDAYRKTPSLEAMERIVRKASFKGPYDYGRKDSEVGRAVQAALALPELEQTDG